MASTLRVSLVTCIALCLFSSIPSSIVGQDVVDEGQGNFPGDFQADRRIAKRAAMPAREVDGRIDAGGVPVPAGGAGNMGNIAANVHQAGQVLNRAIGQQQQWPGQQPQYGQGPPQPQLQQLGQQQGPGPQGGFAPGPNQGQAFVNNPPNFNQGQGMQGQGGQGGGYRGDVPRNQPWQGNVAKPKPGHTNSNRPIRIFEHPACKNDVVALCGKNTRGNNFSVLDCLQNAGGRNAEAGDKDGAELSDECNRFLWSYKMNLTTDVRFDSAAFEVCKTEIKRFPDCDRIQRGEGLLLPCMYDVAANITAVQCRQYVNRMKAITFSDYRLIKGFYDQCKEDIVKQGCGTINDGGHAKDQPAPHSQGATINCLEKKVEALQEGCKKQILRVAELSADDYHADRALYFACRDDRERFCEGETAGQGVIYNCLLNHKFKEDMSEACRNKLTTRQKVVSLDYKANYRLARKCREDIKKTGCNKPKDSQGREFRLSALLICLENAKHKGTKLTGDCVAELEDTRKSLMEDFSVNPEIITNCKREINDRCAGGLQRGGKTLHCLMKLTQEKENVLSQDCETALQDLVKTADAGANYRIDTALHKACKPVRDKLCANEEAGDAKVLSCLMENIYSPDMTKECESELLLLQYFVSRDFKLDPLLFKNCENDVSTFCYEDDWQNSDLPQGLVFACLHRHLHPDRDDQALSTGCQAQVHRVLRQRAVSVHLNPQIEANCREDLGRHCTDRTGKGEELSCLQENLEKLQDECHKMIGDFTVEEAEDIKMNRKLMAACAPMIKQFCKDFLTKKVDEGAALQCLIDHKNDDDMNEKCAAGIEHFQLIQIKEYRFNFKFKEACRKDVMRLCKESKDKASIVKCLSTWVRDDTLQDRQHNVSEECRKQLRAELLQRSEDIKLDPELFKGCESDVKKFCHNLKAGNARILECLRDHRKELENECHIKLFNRQKEQAQMVKTDFAFMHSCKRMIKQFCVGVAPDDLFKCLKSHKSDPTFDSNCKAVLTKRAIQNKEDFRLNPMLQKACRRDMPKFCKEIQDKTRDQPGVKDQEHEGEMLDCLKKKFSTKQLSPDCENYIRDTIHEAAMDFRIDPILSRACKETAKKLCSEQLETPGQGQVEECLKSKLHDGKIGDPKCRLQVIRLLQEGRADVHVDPLLYKACALDIKHFCAGIPQGEGRQMSCLLETLEDSTVKLHGDCRTMLTDRKEMWGYAVKVAPPGSIQDVVYSINASEQRGYILTVLLVIVGVLFFGGLCCGRATKRVRAELKNK